MRSKLLLLLSFVMLNLSLQANEKEPYLIESLDLFFIPMNPSVTASHDARSSWMNYVFLDPSETIEKSTNLIYNYSLYSLETQASVDKGRQFALYIIQDKKGDDLFIYFANNDQNTELGPFLKSVDIECSWGQKPSEKTKWIKMAGNGYLCPDPESFLKNLKSYNSLKVTVRDQNGHEIDNQQFVFSPGDFESFAERNQLIPVDHYKQRL